MARKFYYVCAGMLMLSLSYHFGFTTAAAQAPGVVECAAVDDTGSGIAWFGVVNRHLYWQCSFSSSCQTLSLYAHAPIPGTARVVGCGYGYAVLETGEVYQWPAGAGGSGSWSLVGNFAGGPTPALRETWGELKSRYR